MRAIRFVAPILLCVFVLTDTATGTTEDPVAHWMHPGGFAGDIAELDYPATASHQDVTAGVMTFAQGVGLSANYNEYAYVVTGFPLHSDPTKYISVTVTGNVTYTLLRFSWVAYAAGIYSSQVELRAVVGGNEQTIGTSQRYTSHTEVEEIFDLSGLGQVNGTVEFRLLFSGPAPGPSYNHAVITGPNYGGLGLRIFGTVGAGPANTAPTVQISSPADGSTVSQGQSVTFTGTASDAEDTGLSGANLQWDSGGNNFGSGASFSYSGLGAGQHTIKAEVTDSGGLTGSAQITLHVVNTAPTVQISNPADGSTINLGESITFTGSATDAEDNDVTLTGNLSWTSSKDNVEIGSGGSFSYSQLSEGVHVITAQVTDTGGLPGSKSVTITVNGPPSVNISSPTDGATLTQGEWIPFLGTASDLQDQGLSGDDLEWFTGATQFGNGASFSYMALGLGQHTITAKVTDSGGLTGSAEITIHLVNTAPTVHISSPSNGATFNQNQSITFTGTASDVQDAGLSGADLEWYAGTTKIGDGASFDYSLLLEERIRHIPGDGDGD
ncbi:Ig-like domain-containing protein, partial [Planctomycetota bacterium]